MHSWLGHKLMAGRWPADSCETTNVLHVLRHKADWAKKTQWRLLAPNYAKNNSNSSYPQLTAGSGHWWEHWSDQ